MKPARTVQKGGTEWLSHPMVGPVGGGVLVAFLSHSSGASQEVSLLAALAFVCAASVTARPQAWRRFLSRWGVLTFSAGGALLGALVLVAPQPVTDMPQLGFAQLAFVFVFSWAGTVVPRSMVNRCWKRERKLRVAVIGSAWASESLARELRLSPVTRYVVIGRIAWEGDAGEAERQEVPLLGELGELCELCAGHQVDILVMTGEVPRLRVFDEIASSCLHLGVRLWQLSGFYEEVFGHVPVAEINAAWFQYILHPHYRASSRRTKRGLDLTFAIGAGMLLLAPVALLMLLIRRDGGPALYRQVRIGEGGRPFTLYKLRSMHTATGISPRWASADDPRVTRLGRVLRKCHLDEIPQLVNVLRGEMSIVGPRPEQPAFVERLESELPFYQRRHLIKPGITGWAQVRCGYAGSELGSAWKLCHDLYYVKHRSLIFDLAILAETVPTFFADRQYTRQLQAVSFIVGAARVSVSSQDDVAIPVPVEPLEEIAAVASA